jgi:hypothetical protein
MWTSLRFLVPLERFRDTACSLADFELVKTGVTVQATETALAHIEGTKQSGTALEDIPFVALNQLTRLEYDYSPHSTNSLAGG